MRPFEKENAFPSIQRRKPTSRGFVMSLMSISRLPRYSAKVLMAVTYWHLPPSLLEPMIGADYTVRELEEVQSEIVQGICTPHPLHHPVHILPGKLLVREAGYGIQHPLGNPLRLLLDGLGLDA